MVQVWGGGNDDDLGTGRLQHLLPAAEDVRNVIAVREDLGARLIALTQGNHPTALGLKGGDVGAAEAETYDADRGSRRGHWLSSLAIRTCH